MRKKYAYQVDGKTVEREYFYIPVRFIIAVLIMAFEVIAVIGIVIACCYYIPYFYCLAWVTEICCVVHIIASDENPDYKVPWLLVVLVIPIAGFMLYFLFYRRKLPKKVVRRLQQLHERRYLRDDGPVLQQLHQEDPAVCSQANMLTKIADCHVFTNTAQTYFPLGEDMHKSLLADLESAQTFIYMEYFIIEEGAFWNSILEILKRKAAAGVDVKVIYDDIGCMAVLPGDYYKTLRSYGIDSLPFSTLRGNADSEFNNRSHRKITVIDGRIGYTGGVNLADEYINEIHPYGHWKDTGIRLEGQAVWELTKLFWMDYGTYKHKIETPCYDLFPESQSSARGYVIPFGDGPHPIYQRRVGKSVIQNMLSGAQRYVYMTSPYLIIDNDLCQSIENAALRGVDVRIIVPGIPDKKIIFGMTRSFYPRLMAAGVKIYEYTPGFIHAKSYLCDDELAMIGTINLDYRSLVHHFENGVWMYRCDAVGDLKQDILDTMDKSALVTDDMLKTNLVQKIVRSLVRIFAPML